MDVLNKMMFLSTYQVQISLNGQPYAVYVSGLKHRVLITGDTGKTLVLEIFKT